MQLEAVTDAVFGFILLQDLTKQLDEVTQNSEIVEIRQKEAECELEAARDRVQQQATEILLKASKALPLLSFALLLIHSPCERAHPRYPRDASSVLSCANASSIFAKQIP